MILNTRIEFNNLSTRARADVKRGHFYIDRSDTAPSVTDIIDHEGVKYEVTSVDRANMPSDTRRIHVRPVARREPEPLADWERELLYGTTGPMPTRDIVKAALERSAGREVLSRVGVGGERHLKSLLGHAVVLAKQEMALYHEREAARKTGEDALARKLEVGEATHKAIVESTAYAIIPGPEEARGRPTIADTLEAVVYYVDASAWEGRFERIVRSIRKPMTLQGMPSRGTYVHGGPVPVGTSIHGMRNGMN